MTSSWEEKNDKALRRDIDKGSGNFPSLNYLKLTKRQQLASIPLERKLDSVRPNCEGRSAEFIDYEEGNGPTAGDAYEMCKGCPMLVECARFSNAYRPPVGVWGGQVWKDGKVMKDE